jgi:hypothetical protein
MRSLIITGLCSIAIALAVGCKNHNNGDTDTSTGSSPQHMSTTDACDHCPGVQTATADGKCPVCGGPAKKM